MKKRNLIYFVFSVLFFVTACSTKQNQLNPYEYYTVKQKTFSNAAVSSAHALASEVGALILKKGGNAIDAAVAVQYALAVVYPNAGNIGGGGFLVYRDKNNEAYTIDFREKAPSAAFKDMYLDKDGNAVPSMSRDGHLAAGVPGSVAGMELAHKKHGKLGFKELIQPAIDLAEHGFVITKREAAALNRMKKDFDKYSTVQSAFQKDTPWQEKDTLIQMDLANTLKRIQSQGAKGFYEGETAQLIVEEMKRGGGIISAEDLKTYQAVEREPIHFDYKNYRIISMGLPSSGGVMINQMLKMLEPYPIKEYGFESKEAVQLMVEIERRAYADRTEYMGDPDFVDVPVKQLLDPEYIQNRMQDFEMGVPSKSDDIKAGLSKEKEETTHFSIIDEEGNAVAVTTTINGSYGNRVVVGGAGFILNNEMDDFSAKPGAPNKFGLLGTEANAIAPGKRMLSAMTPTIVLKNKDPYLVLGTPGGSTIITSVFQTLVNILEFDLSPSDAVNKPKFHHQWRPDLIYVERDYPSSLRAELEDMGYTFKERNPIGRTEVLKIENGKIDAVADKRGDDSVAGY